MNLRAQNLNTFVQLAEGLDAKTWVFHLKRHDYSNWIRHSLKDPELADEIAEIENDEKLQESENRQRVTQAILKRYTAST
jgi:hypothetical protein